MIPCFRLITSLIHLKYIRSLASPVCLAGKLSKNEASGNFDSTKSGGFLHLDDPLLLTNYLGFVVLIPLAHTPLKFVELYKYAC